MKPRTEERRAKSLTINELIGLNIRTLREAQDLTQRDCSRILASSSESYWRCIETGHKEMSLLRVVEIAEVLGCPAAKLLEGV